MRRASRTNSAVPLRSYRIHADTRADHRGGVVEELTEHRGYIAVDKADGADTRN